MKQSCSWENELKYKKKKITSIAGIDEVGRGAWAGPIVAAAFMFYTFPCDIEVFDSKVLTAKQRAKLAGDLKEWGVAAIGEATSMEIDRFGLQEAQYMAYRRAINRLPTIPQLILLDGRPWPNCPLPHNAIVDGDATVASIAAASIMAKEYRDAIMKTTIHSRFSDYGFDTHVGYGTDQHQRAIYEFGLTPVHRRSFQPIQTFMRERGW